MTNLSARREKFVQAYVSGLSAKRAYEMAYGKSSGAKASASRLLTFVNVLARLRELQQKQVIAALMTRDLARQYLYRVVFTPIGQVDPSSDLCQSFEVQGHAESPDVRELGGANSPVKKPGWKRSSVKIVMPDKLRAIELDSKLSGEWYAKAPAAAQSDAFAELLATIRAGETQTLQNSVEA